MRTLLFILTLGLFSCNSTEKKQVNAASTDLSKDTIISDTTTVFKKNMYDINHYKQGQWDIKKNGKIKGYETFKNDTLDGPYREWINYPGQIVTGQYKMGLQHGLQKHFENDSQVVMISNFNMGKILWTGFLGNAGYPKPPKGFHIHKDSILVECPYSNDTIWYRGVFINKKPVGIHKMFYPNGKPRFEYNYSNEKIKVFDKNGTFIKEVKDDYSFNIPQ
jgi:antitoxin component YwqK of YwqJK toxin-antitoxin module